MLRKTFKFLLLSTVIFNLVSCASYFKRKECEKVNWHEYGDSVAHNGIRLDADPFIKSCEDVEAKIDYVAADLGFKAGMEKYCQPKTAYKYGRDGKKFNLQMCDSPKGKKIAKAYRNGVNDFCQPESGFRVGKSGYVYDGLCSAKQEKIFMPKYNEGRKVYLKSQLRLKRAKVTELEQSIYTLKEEQNTFYMQLSQVRENPVYRTEKVYDPVTKVYREETKMVEDEVAKRKRENLQRDIDRVNSTIRSRRNKIKNLKLDIVQTENEIMSL